MRPRGVVAAVALVLLAATPAAASSGPGRAAAAVPLDAGSPWPEMRHDARNTGESPIVAHYRGDRPWVVRTGRGIFSTPVIGTDGTVYVGSADDVFYAVTPAGRVRWRIETGGLIDAAGALSAFDPRVGSAPLTFGSGDDRLYHVTTPRRGRPRILWTFRASVGPVAGQKVDWWEGNVAIGPRGVIYAGNTGGTAYALAPNGSTLWTFTAGNSLWTTPAFTADGSSFWGSVDLHAYRLSPTGRPAWSTFIPGYVISSPAIGSDGTVYVGGFDSRLYALDPRTGAARWTFKTRDHIYASPALSHDRRGRTRGIYIASTDGTIDALSPSGAVRWSYDTGAPVRSSPALGRSPDGREVLYVGSSNGVLYALDAATGHLRWAYDTTRRDPSLRVRNNLNGSPALGATGVYIGGQDGDLYYVPYDYCLHRRDPRCVTRSAGLPAEETRVFAVDAGGDLIAPARMGAVSSATVINLRLVVRRHGQTVNAAILDPVHVVSARPRFAFTVQESGDGHYLYVLPTSTLAPGTAYRLRVAGAYTNNGANMGNFNPGGTVAGRFAQTLTLHTARAGGGAPLRVGPRAVSAMTITRLSVAMPAFLPSVNQIGFDSYDWIATTIARTRHTVLMWVIGARRDAHGHDAVDPHSAFGFPLFGRLSGRSLILSSPGVPLQFSFGPVPLRRFELAGTLRPGPAFVPAASLYADTVCATVPHYGPELLFTGICNPSGVLAASGTFDSAPYHGPAARRPAGVRVSGLVLTPPSSTAPGGVTARLAGSRLPSAAGHVAAILLTDASTGQPVAVQPRSATTLRRDARGRIVAVHLALPAGTALPAFGLRYYVMVDGFPIDTSTVPQSA
jgi:outer membrane protein assembly factor BamB